MDETGKRCCGVQYNRCEEATCSRLICFSRPAFPANGALKGKLVRELWERLRVVNSGRANNLSGMDVRPFV